VAKTQDKAIQSLKLKGFEVVVEKEGSLTATLTDNPGKTALTMTIAKTEFNTTLVLIAANGVGGLPNAAIAEDIGRGLQATLSPGSATLARLVQDDATLKRNDATTTPTALASTQKR
jgi:hypothetical protein